MHKIAKEAGRSASFCLTSPQPLPQSGRGLKNSKLSTPLSWERDLENSKISPPLFWERGIAFGELAPINRDSV
jgi:hypothetical protein